MKSRLHYFVYGAASYLLLSFMACCNAEATEDDSFKVAILMFEGVQIIDFAAPYEVFGHAGFDVVTVSKNGNSLTTTMGLKVTPDHSFDSLPAVNAVIVPGGNVNNISKDPSVLSWLRRQTEASEHMLSVCNGAFALAEAGLLDNLEATTFYRALDNLQANFPQIEVSRDKRFVDNGRIMTSAGLSSGLDAALHLVSKVKGLDNAKTVAMHIEYDWDPEQGFVRGKMADKHFPEPDYDWPNDAKFSRLSAYGNETRFIRSYAVTTSAGQQQLQQIIVNAMKEHKDWRQINAGVKQYLAWRGQDTLSDWDYHVIVSPESKPGRYVLTATIYQQQ